MGGLDSHGGAHTRHADNDHVYVEIVVLKNSVSSFQRHILEKLSKWIVLGLCFSVSFRMLLDTLKIRNGENLFFIQNKKQLLLLSIALGINAFIVGLMADFYEPFQNITPYIIMGVAFIWSIIEMAIPFSKMKLTLNSLLNSICAGVILVKGLLLLI